MFHSTDFIGNIIWLLIFFSFIFFYPRLIIAQMLWNLEKTAVFLERLSSNGKNLIIKRISSNPSNELKERISNFLEFFIIEPVSLDPFGIVRKIEHLLNLEERKLKHFVSQVAPNFDSEAKANLAMGLVGAISLNQIAKVVRHFVELIKKTKNLQLALLLQMQLPLIEKLSKALLRGTEALIKGWPIGDSIGSLVAAKIIGKSKTFQIMEDTVIAKKKIDGKEVIVMKARGPGGRLGKLGRSVEKLIRKEKIGKIITIDAAAKLESEKTGSIAEGIGVAIGGIGVDRSFIEEIATKKNIPLDSIVIKMSPEEAIMPMKPEIFQTFEKVVERVENNIKNSKVKGKVLVIGVGNSVGIKDGLEDVKELEEKIKNISKIMKEREEKEKKEKKLFKI